MKDSESLSALYQKTSFAPWQRRFGLWTCFRRHRTHVYSSFNDYGGQMSQHLNCECWSLITMDTYHGWMLADLHSGTNWDGVNDYQINCHYYLASNWLIGVSAAVVLVAKRDTLFDLHRWWVFMTQRNCKMRERKKRGYCEPQCEDT